MRGITANREALRLSVEQSIGIVTALNPYIGYANATAVAQEAHASGRSVHEVVLEKGLLSKETARRDSSARNPDAAAADPGSRRCGARRRGGGHDGHRRGCTRDMMQDRTPYRRNALVIGSRFEIHKD